MEEYIAVSAGGLESVTAAELVRLGADVVEARSGGVRFRSDAAVFYRTLLSLRTASRVLKPLREFAAGTPAMLYSQARRVKWEDWLSPAQTFAIDATLERRETRKKPLPRSAAGDVLGKNQTEPDRRAGRPRCIENSMYAAQVVKDAVCDRLRRERGARPNVNRENPDLIIHAHFAEGRCQLSVDATRRSLHERGYRVRATEAPLKETLAAGIIELAGWNGQQPLYDPFCGSGTIVIEAALKALDVAPGFAQQQLLCRNWPGFDAALWEEVAAQARSQRKTTLPALIFASDVDAKAVEAARANASAAGVAEAVKFFVRRAEDAEPPCDSTGVVVTNPPYGVRLGDEAALVELYRRFGQVLDERFAGWTAWVLAGNLSCARHIELPAAEKIRLHNGPIVCRLLKFALTGARGT